MNSTMMTCTMPEVRLPSDFYVNNTATHFESVRGPNDRNVSMRGEPGKGDHAAMYVGLLFDGYNFYRNLTAVMPDITFKFFQPPTLDSAVNLINYRPHSFSDIDIMVRLLRFCQRYLLSKPFFSRPYATVIAYRLSPSLTLCIVAKRCVLQQKLLLTMLL